MKYTVVIIACLAFAAGGIVALNWPKDLRPVDAQDGPGVVSVKKADSSRSLLQASDDREFPAFGVHEVIDRLTTEVEQLIEQKAVKTSAELKSELDRSSFPMTFTAPVNDELSPEELYRQSIESVFLIAGLTKPTEEDDAWATSFSTAFVVREDGILSTSAHVFDHNDRDDAVVVLDVHGQVYPVIEVLAATRKSDTCLFRIRASGLKPLRLGSEIAPGSQIRVIGHPGDSFFYFSAGNLANYEKDADDNFWLNITADFGQGSSGGPVMDRAGNVVGQVSRTYTLYAGGETSNRGPRRHTADKKDTPNEENKDGSKGDPESDSPEVKKRPDPQMVFKACTPVSAIKALTK